VDKVSVSFATGESTEKDAGHWNTTIYGTRFIRMAKLMGSGPMQIGIGCWVPPFNASGAYPGPWSYNIPNPSN
jgi:hypothetical protein